jgi:hypothetical protein
MIADLDQACTTQCDCGCSGSGGPYRWWRKESVSAASVETTVCVPGLHLGLRTASCGASCTGADWHYRLHDGIVNNLDLTDARDVHKWSALGNGAVTICNLKNLNMRMGRRERACARADGCGLVLLGE